MEKIMMQDIRKKMEENDFSFNVYRLTMTQKLGMIHYVFEKQLTCMPKVMKMLLNSSKYPKERQIYVHYLLQEMKSRKDVFPFEMLSCSTLISDYSEREIETIFGIVRDKIGNKNFKYEQLLMILEMTLLPSYQKGKNEQQDHYYKLAQSIQKQIYRQIKDEYNTQFLEHKKLLFYLQTLPHQFSDYFNKVKTLKK